MSESEAALVKQHVRVYVMVFAALAVLTVVTVAISYLQLPTAYAIAIAMVVATVKASLVALYFMHLISEEKVILWLLRPKRHKETAMSLKAFHIVFIVLSTALAIGLGVWATRNFAQSGSWVHLSLGVGSFIGSVVLACYGVWFLRKLKHVSYL